VLGFVRRKVRLRQLVADGQVGVLGQKAEVGHGIHLGPLEGRLVFVELRLREDMVHFQPAHFAKKAGLQRQAGAPIAGIAHTGQQVQHRVETCPQAPAAEVAGLEHQSAVPQAQLLNQLIQTTAHILKNFKVSINEALSLS